MQPCENERKETFWLLAINGVSAAGGHDIVPPVLVPVGGMHGPPSEEDQPHRAMQSTLMSSGHVFCPVAAAVRNTVSAETQIPSSALWRTRHAPGIYIKVRHGQWCVYNTQQWRPRTLAVVAGISHDSPECMGDT